MPLLRFVIGLSPVHAVGTCILAVFFTTLGGGYRHYRLGNVDLKSVTPIMIAGAISAFASSCLFSHLALRDRWLDLGIGLVFLLVSSRIVIEGIRRNGPEKSSTRTDPAVGGSTTWKIIIGAVAGFFPGLLGIGTGGVLVPAIRYKLHSTIRTAMAASLVCFCANAAISAAMKISSLLAKRL